MAGRPGSYQRRTKDSAYQWPSLAHMNLDMCAATLALPLAACQPSVQLKAPDKPIVSGLNVKIEREVRVKIEREVEDLVRYRKDLF